MNRPYSIGDSATVRMDFSLEATGQLADPTTVALKVRTPSGDTTTYLYGSFAITAANHTTKVFTIAGRHSILFPEGHSFTVTGSAANNGTYTVRTTAETSTTTDIDTNESFTNDVAGGTISLDLTKDAVGRYRYVISLTEAGQWALHVTGTGTVPKVEEATIEVKPSAYSLD